MQFLFDLVGVLILVTLASACQIYNNISEKILTQVEEDYEEYEDYNYDFDQLPTSSTTKVISSGLILCANLSSVDNISINYTYTEENYEQHLIIEKSNIPTIKQSAFSNFTTITKLFLSHINIRTILPGAFNGLTELKELHLSHNEIREITKGVYNSLNKLEILTLNDNKIHKIENMALTGIDNLYVLHLQRNSIKNIGDMFVYTPNLTYLDLSHNPLSELFVGNLTKLEVLNLTGTSFSQIDKFNFSSTFRVLNISNTQITQVDISLFSEIDTLDLAFNRIKILENCQVIDGSVKTVNVTNLSMSHNLLESLKGSLFNGSLKLREIDFGFNKILTISYSTFHGLYNLESLFLNNNKIREIPHGLFKDLKLLENLDLSSNLIQKLQFGVFDSLSNLQTLDISNNRLTSPNNHYNFQL